MNESLFDSSQIPEKPPTPERTGTVRIEKPERTQIEVRIESLDERIPWDHPVRTVWEFVERLDFEDVHGDFKSFAGGPGRSVKDRRILFAIWLYGYSEGIGSARRLDALCRRDDAYRWLAGDVAPHNRGLPQPES
ncbi:MAG: transposase [Bryobacteraceae bacterium]|nr:transposase [Bryobacteraceae bacterium]